MCQKIHQSFGTLFFVTGLSSITIFSHLLPYGFLRNEELTK